MNLKKLFLNHCKKNNLEINSNQLELVDQLNDFYNLNFNKSFFKKIFSKKNTKPGFYLQGDVGVGKTMILNFFYENFKLTKQRIHFNEFMISFHDFKFKNKENNNENIIDRFVQKLKKNYELIYFDEFQVTNIVDAMILGNLFKKIFNENIKVLFSSNIKINDLYKDGLQRDHIAAYLGGERYQMRLEDESLLCAICAGEVVEIGRLDNFQSNIIKQWWSLGFLEERFLNETH